MTDHPPVLHGITLSPHKPSKGIKKPSANWTYGARVSPEMATLIDTAARTANVRQSDILRSALAFYFAGASAANRPQQNLTDPTEPNHISQPRQTNAYRGSGGSDFKQIRTLTSANTKLRNSQTSHTSQRLVDKSPVR